MVYTFVKRAVPEPLRQQLRPIRQFLADAAHHPGFVLSRTPVTGDLLAAAAPLKQPPILIISLPRAGSSWIGGVIGLSEDALYLREPMTQSYHVARRNGLAGGQNGGPTRAVFERGACQDGPAYDRFASLAFRGMPRFPRAVIPHPEQWTVSGRTCKRVVIKEVNPLALDHWQEAFQPKVIYLLRHPVAVARSFHALGWKGDQFSNKFLPATLTKLGADLSVLSRAEFWEQSGAFQAILHNHVLGSLDRVDHVLVRYEDVCQDPLTEFARLFEFCGLPLSATVRDAIARSSKSKTDYAPGRYDTVRNSSTMTGRWRRETPAEQVELVRRGYFAHHPRFYTEESEW
jgi:Sulfotransferase domain